MSDHGIACGACGAANAADAFVCGACGALLAAYATPAGAGDETVPPDPAAARTSVAPSAPGSPGPTVVEEQPTVAPPAGGASGAAGRVSATEAAAAGEPLPGGDAPTEATRATQPATEPPAPLDESESAISAGPADVPAPEWTAPAFGADPDRATPDGPPRAFEIRWQHQWSTRRETPLDRRARLMLTRRLGKGPPTGIPPVVRLDGWGPGQMLVAGIGLLLGACAVLAVGTAAGGGGCLLSFALLAGAIGILLTVNAARRLFGNALDGE